MNILLIGSGAREHAIAKAIKKSAHKNNLFVFGPNKNPGIMALATKFHSGRVDDAEMIMDVVFEHSVDFVIIGPEDTLTVGVVDALKLYNIPAFGPSKLLAKLESSKGFTRNLLNKYNIPGNPKFKTFTGKSKFTNMDGEIIDNRLAITKFIKELEDGFVVKYDALHGGKGVKVSGEHLHSIEEGINYALECLDACGAVVIEEKLVGQEFSLIAITDGNTVLETPAIQDHKRAYYGDVGPNTGGMGTYSDADHSLPFLTKQNLADAHEITVAVMKALHEECKLYQEDKERYQGVMYGGFIATKNGVKLIEYNARFGDPEAMNIFTLLKTDFIDICLAVFSGTLDKIKLEFENLATVCKYIVPSGYPDQAIKNSEIILNSVPKNCEVFMGSVYSENDKMYLAGSRAIAFVGKAPTIAEAEQIAEQGACSVVGPVFHRADIGTKELIQKRVDQMKEILSTSK